MPWLFLACAPCPSFDSMTYSEDAGELSAIVAEFAAWTGRDGVCVPEVEVVAEIAGNPAIAGRYHGPDQPIELRRTHGDYGPRLRHELCHALDDQEGWSEVLAVDLDTSAIPRGAYPTDALARAEAFALVCELGPADVPFQSALTETCETTDATAAAAVTEAVYVDAEPGLPVDAVLAPAETGIAATEGPIVAVASAAEGLWLRTEAVEAWWSPEGAAPVGAAGAWAEAGGAARGPDGRTVAAWWWAGVSGARVDGEGATTLVTDCTATMSGGIPAWVGGEPGLVVSAPAAAFFGGPGAP